MLHEFTHFFLASQFSGEYPPSFNEGLAELMGYARFKQRSVDRSTSRRLVSTRLAMATGYHSIACSASIIPIRSISLTGWQPRSTRNRGSRFTTAWSRTATSAGRSSSTSMSSTNWCRRKMRHSASFGDLATADKLLRDYSRQNSLTRGGMDLGEMPQVTLPAGSPLAEMDTLAMLAGVMLDSRLPRVVSGRWSTRSNAAILTRRVLRYWRHGWPRQTRTMPPSIRR